MKTLLVCIRTPLFIIFGLFLSSYISTAHAAISLLSHTQLVGAGSSPAINTTGATLIVIQLMRWGYAPNTPTDSKGNTWTALTTHNNPGASYFGQYYYVCNPTTSTTHTFAHPDSSFITIAAFSGTATTNCFDSGTDQSAKTGLLPAPLPAITPSVSGDLIVSGIAENSYGADNVSPDQGLTVIEKRSSGNPNAAFAWGVYNSTSPLTVSWTIGQTFDSQMILAAFKPASQSFDTTPPSAPTNLSATAISSSAINLSWTASTDNVAVTGYKIYRGGVQIATSPTTSYSDTGLSPSTAYSYTVSAYDAATNTSAQSTTASATTQTVSSSLGWIDLTNTQLQNVCPPNGFMGAYYQYSGIIFECYRPITSWASGSVDTRRNRLLFMGDGHVGQDDNAVYSLDMTSRSGSIGTSCGSFGNCSTNSTTPTLTRLNDPSTGGSGTTLPCPAQLPPDGAPIARETYGALIYLPKSDTLWNYGTSDRCGDGFGTVGYGFPYVLAFNADGSPNGWTKNNPGPGDSGAGSECTLDTLWTGTGDAIICLVTRYRLYRYTLFNDTWTLLTNNITVQNGGSIVLDPTRRLIFSIGPNYNQTFPAMWAIDYDSPNTATAWTSTVAGCDDLIAYPYPSLVWDPTINSIVGYVPSTAAAPGVANNQILTFDPGSRTCTTRFSGGGPAAHPNLLHGLGAAQGMFGRFNYIPVLNRYVLVNNPYLDAYSFNLGGNPPPSDTTPPSVPTNLTATAVASSQINLSWNASTDNIAVSGYQVFRNGSQIAATTVVSYSDTGLTPATAYTYTVSASDASGNISAQSASSTATTLDAPDTTPPMVSLSAQGSNNQSISANSTVLGNLTFTVNASDPLVAKQTTSGIALVTLTLDGSVIASSTTGNLTYTLSTRTLANTNHSLVAVARDVAGNIAYSQTFQLNEIGFMAGWQ